MSFDIRKIAIGLTGDMPVKDVDGEIVKDEKGKELSITFFSPGSKEYVKAKAELQSEIMEEFAAEEEAKKAAEESKKNPGKAKEAPKAKLNPEDDAEKTSRRTADFLAKITKSLNGFSYEGGPKALYMDATLGHITEDADKYVMKRGNFKPGSASGSSSTSDTQPG